MAQVLARRQGLPTGEAPILRGVRPRASFDIDIPVIPTQGTITVDGQAPSEGRRGRVSQWVGTELGTQLIVQEQGAATFEGVVFDLPSWFVLDGASETTGTQLLLDGSPTEVLDADVPRPVERAVSVNHGPELLASPEARGMAVSFCPLADGADTPAGPKSLDGRICHSGARQRHLERQHLATARAVSRPPAGLVDVQQRQLPGH